MAAHGEYLPVNQCLEDDAKSENKAVIVVKKLSKIVSECSRADKSEDFECLKKVYNKHAGQRIHIFGIIRMQQ